LTDYKEFPQSKFEELRKFAFSSTNLDLSSIDAPSIDFDMLTMEREENPIFEAHFGTNYTKKLIEKFDYQYEHNQNVIINSWGQPRSTKTYSNISLAGQTDYPVDNIDLIFFKIDELNEYLPRLKPNDTIIQDEHDEVFGTGTKRLELEYVRMVETLGKRMINWFITSPIPRAIKHSYFLIRALRLIDYSDTIEVLDTSTKKKHKEGTLSYVELTDNRFNTLGHLRIINPRLLKTVGNKFMDAYEHKKNDFLDTIQRKHGGSYLSEMALGIMDSEQFKNFEEIVKKLLAKEKKKYKGLKYNDVYAIVNEVHPELRGNIEAKTIANTIIHKSITSKGWQPRG
jgi:hypothetical protein